MGADYPRFGVNFKIYPETIGKKGLEFAKMVDEVQQETGATFSVAPQIPDLRMIAEETDLLITAPYCDAVEPGRGMGKILPETLKEAGADGVSMNHVENPDGLDELALKIERCQEVGLKSSVLVGSLKKGRAVAQLEPDALLFEVPGDISGDVAVTQQRPDAITEFIEMVEGIDSSIRVSTGGGIQTGDDVRKAYELGLDYTGASSGIVKADDPRARLTEIGEVVAEFQNK